MIELQIIGYVHTPWREKFGIPRQSGMAEAVEAEVRLDPELIPPEALRGLEQLSHLWLLTWLHESPADGWRPTVRPPRLGGARRLGVFATRSPHRPNPIGLTVVRLAAIEDRTLRVSGADLLDATPVLDIKPYVPWADIVDARCEWADDRPAALTVELAPAAEQALLAHPQAELLRSVIVDSLRWDPRPAHQRDEPEREYAVRLLDVDVRFRMVAGAGAGAGAIEVLSVALADPRTPADQT